LITRADLQTLLIPSATPTPYAIGATGAAVRPYSPFNPPPAPGTFYSDWSALAASIPAGTGKACAISALCGAGAWDDTLLTPPFDQMVTLTAYLELGDASSNVVATVEVATYHYEQALQGYDGDGYAIYDEQQTVVAAFVAGQDVTLSAIATKKRAKLVISADRWCEASCQILTGGYVEM
jgi:hypothetical protein